MVICSLHYVLFLSVAIPVRINYLLYQIHSTRSFTVLSINTFGVDINVEETFESIKVVRRQIWTLAFIWKSFHIIVINRLCQTYFYVRLVKKHVKPDY